MKLVKKEWHEGGKKGKKRKGKKRKGKKMWVEGKNWNLTSCFLNASPQLGKSSKMSVEKQQWESKCYLKLNSASFLHSTFIHTLKMEKLKQSWSALLRKTNARKDGVSVQVSWLSAWILSQCQFYNKPDSVSITVWALSALKSVETVIKLRGARDWLNLCVQGSDSLAFNHILTSKSNFVDLQEIQRYFFASLYWTAQLKA